MNIYQCFLSLCFHSRITKVLVASHILRNHSTKHIEANTSGLELSIEFVQKFAQFSRKSSFYPISMRILGTFNSSKQFEWKYRECFWIFEIPNSKLNVSGIQCNGESILKMSYQKLFDRGDGCVSLSILLWFQVTIAIVIAWIFISFWFYSME